MILISHRGNMNGIEKTKENTIEQINLALSKGYDVEVDVWYENGNLYLGHDKPEEKVDLEFLQNSKLWCHAKNSSALEYMILYDVQCFWHERDKFTLTSSGFIWTYPGEELTKKSICVMPEEANLSKSDVKKAAGVCSDYISSYKEIDSE